MKIYATSDITKPFEPFVGKDIWVLCEVKLGPSLRETTYIRFYEIIDTPPAHSDNPIAECTWLSPDDVERFQQRNFAPWYCITSLAQDNGVELANVTIVEPLTTLTSEEICSNYYSDVDELLAYVGTDMWIKVMLYEGSCFYDQYIKITSNSGPILKYHALSPDLLDESFIERYRYNGILEELEEEQKINAHLLKISRPLEILTDDEVNEIIDQVNIVDD